MVDVQTHAQKKNKATFSPTSYTVACSIIEASLLGGYMSLGLTLSLGLSSKTVEE